MINLRRNLRNQREDENEIYAKSEYISDGAIDFYKIDHAGDILRARLRRRLEEMGDSIAIDILNEYDRLDDVEDALVRYMDNKAREQRPLIRRITKMTESFLQWTRGK